MHQHYKEIESDDNFETGTLSHIVPGNEGRVLDGRRTPGYIESYDEESAMFVWRITDFEDKGKCWEIPAEQISNYQFRKHSKHLSADDTEKISLRCNSLNKQLKIKKNDDIYACTLEEINSQKKVAREWLQQHSAFFKKHKKLDFDSQVGYEELFSDLEEYLRLQGVYELELKTANQYLINPYSGEWIKGMKIVMAELGLIDYAETAPRTKEIFLGIGLRELRKKYIIIRTAFIQSVFELLEINEVPLYRGMSSFVNLYETPCTLVSSTFSVNTAKEFAAIDSSADFKSCYFVKFMYPVSNLFMTFFETKQFNERYKEQEAIIYYRDKLTF